MSNSNVAGQSSADPEHNVEEIAQLVHDIRCEQNGIRKSITFGTVAILLILIGFGMGIYSRMHENFAQEKMRAALEAKTRLLLPQLEPPLRATLNEVVPHYVEIGRERFQAMGPKLEARVKAEADKLALDLEKQINAQVAVTYGRVMNNLSVRLARDFPCIAQDGGARASEQLKTVMMEEGVDLTQHTRKLYETQAGQIRKCLMSFPVPDVSQTDEAALQRQLLHSLLMFADYELTVR